VDFVRKVANSDILAGVIELPESLKHKKVEILILPYENIDTEDNTRQKVKKARGLLEKYKNKRIQDLEEGAWAKAVVDKHENS